jgi:hypothetical protein
VKVDFDASPKLVAELQRAQAILNLPAGLPLTSFITPDGKLYFRAGYLPSEHKGEKSSFRKAADEALARYVDKSRIDEESFHLEIRHGERVHHRQSTHRKRIVPKCRPVFTDRAMRGLLVQPEPRQP